MSLHFLSGDIINSTSCYMLTTSKKVYADKIQEPKLQHDWIFSFTYLICNYWIYGHLFYLPYSSQQLIKSKNVLLWLFRLIFEQVKLFCTERQTNDKTNKNRSDNITITKCFTYRNYARTCKLFAQSMTSLPEFLSNRKEHLGVGGGTV